MSRVSVEHSGLRHQAIEPVTQCIKPLNIIHLFYYPQLATCPQCSSDKETTWEGWTSMGPRKLHGLICEETALSAQLRCNTCKESMKMKKATNKNIPGDVEDVRAHANQPANLEGYCFATMSAAYWSSWEHWQIPCNIPILFYRCAPTRDLFDLLVEMHPSTTSAGLEERVRHECMQSFLLERHSYRICKSAVKTLQAFSSASNPLAYADKLISGEMITEVFLDFCICTRQKESGGYLKTLSVICSSLDNMFKAASKATLTDKDRQKSRELKGGILSVLNEDNQIISWPKMMVTDNCCQVQNAVTSAMPETDSKLNVWHFSVRYITVMIQSSKSPYRGTVTADITGTILKMHAKKGQPAQYWDRAEQEQKLMVAFSKWADKGVWSAAAQKVHQKQLKHVRKGCLECSVQGIRADGSRIEGSHKGWNSLQQAQPSSVTMLAALSHDFVLHRNMRVAFSRPKLTPFLKFANAKLHNTLQPQTTNSQLQLLPELGDINSGKTFGGLLIKEENIEKGLLDSFDSSVDPTTGEEVDLAFLASQNVIINKWQIDPALLMLPAETSRPMKPPVPKRKAVCILLDSDDEGDASGGTIKKLRTLALPSTEVPSIAPGTGQLDVYFPSVQDNQRCTRKIPPKFLQDRPVLTSAATEDRPVLTSTTTEVHQITPNQHYTQKLPPEFLQDCPVVASAAITPDQCYTDCSVLSSAATEDCPVLASTGINNSMAIAAGQTRSQHLFSISTGVDPCSLSFQNLDEFYLCMEMRAEFKLLSYQMTLKRWVLATEEYNRHLIKKKGQSVIQKNPQALLCALGDIEPKLMSKITKNDHTSHKNSESFWRHHCSVVPLVKEEPGRKARKVQTCSRCQTIMYPGPKNSPLNHKKGYCTDGVKQSSKAAGMELPPWPQPQGIFSEGRTFHPHVFLSMVQHVYKHVFMQGPGETDLLETKAFSKLLILCTEVHKSDNMVLFRLFKGFITDPTTPHNRIISHDGGEWLKINYLQQ
ncbi:hypothetical protein BDR03DRAFT_981073 [Suillus americanus]|nr:hypothetical protein BDR03DRAFT_981073 [Suillus americanus]